jgi:hypothetical protein
MGNLLYLLIHGTQVRNALPVDISIKETGKDIPSNVLSVVFKYMLTSMLPGILPILVNLLSVG